MKKPVEPRTIGKINITDALKNVEVLLEQEKSISPQVPMMDQPTSLRAVENCTTPPCQQHRIPPSHARMRSVQQRTRRVSGNPDAGRPAASIWVLSPSPKVRTASIVEDAQGRQFIAEFPTGVTRPVQYGHLVKAQSVYMSQQQLVPYDRIRDYFADQCGIPISAGSGTSTAPSACWRHSSRLALRSVSPFQPARDPASPRRRGKGCFAPLRLC